MKKINFELYSGEKFELTRDNVSSRGKHPNTHYHGDLTLKDLNTNKKDSRKKICSNNLSHYQSFDFFLHTINSCWYWPAYRIIDEAEQLNLRKSDESLNSLLFGKYTAESSYLTFNDIVNSIKRSYINHYSNATKQYKNNFSQLVELAKSEDITNEPSKFIIEFLNRDEEINSKDNTLLSIDEFLKEANIFLNNKSLVINENEEKTFINLISNKKSIASDSKIALALSAGERQFIPMLYQSIVSTEEGCLIIDEPEISLDVEWQSKLGEVFSKKENCQVICFTHSYSFSESFDWAEDTFYLVNNENKIRKIPAKDMIFDNDTN